MKNASKIKERKSEMRSISARILQIKANLLSQPEPTPESEQSKAKERLTGSGAHLGLSGEEKLSAPETTTNSEDRFPETNDEVPIGQTEDGVIIKDEKKPKLSIAEISYLKATGKI